MCFAVNTACRTSSAFDITCGIPQAVERHIHLPARPRVPREGDRDALARLDPAVLSLDHADIAAGAISADPDHDARAAERPDRDAAHLHRRHRPPYRRDHPAISALGVGRQHRRLPVPDAGAGGSLAAGARRSARPRHRCDAGKRARAGARCHPDRDLVVRHGNDRPLHRPADVAAGRDSRRSGADPAQVRERAACQSRPPVQPAIDPAALVAAGGAHQAQFRPRAVVAAVSCFLRRCWCWWRS